MKFSLRFRMILAAVLATGAPHSALASDSPESCPMETIQSNSMNPSLLEIEVKDQGPSGTCYAHVTAELADFYLRNSLNTGMHSTPAPTVHPVWVAYLNSLKNKRHTLKSFRSGAVSDALEEIRQNGVCDYNYIEDALKKGGVAAGKFMGKIDQLLELEQSSPSCTQNDYSIPVTLPFFETERPVASGSPATSVKSPVASIPLLKNHIFLDLFMVQTFPECFGNRKMIHRTLLSKLPKPQILGRVAGRNFETTAAHVLESVIRTGYPVGINHCSGFYNSKQKPAEQSFFDSKNQLLNPSNCGSHAAMIIGQGFIHGQCRYLVRQAWGKQIPRGQICRCWSQDKTYHSLCSEFQKTEKVELLGCYLPRSKVLSATDSLIFEMDPKLSDFEQ